MFLDTGFPTSRASVNHVMYEWILSNSVPPVMEGEATRAKPNSQEFSNGSRLCGETLWLQAPCSSQAHCVSWLVWPQGPGHCSKGQDGCTATWLHWLFIHNIHEMILFLHVFTAVTNSLSYLSLPCLHYLNDFHLRG